MYKRQLLGGVFDKVFTSPETLTVQKLGVLYDAHPALALPDWARYTTLTLSLIHILTVCPPAEAL